MDAGLNYVMDNGDGTYDVVVGGSTIYSSVDKNYAENAYNKAYQEHYGAQPQGATPPPSGVVPGVAGPGGGNPVYTQGTPAASNPYGGTGGTSDAFWKQNNQAGTISNTMDREEAIRQFDAMQALRVKAGELSEWQAREQKRQFELSLTTNFAQSLLNGATQLRGPGDWMQYAQYTGGGRDIFNQMTGNAAPAFGAPTGYSKPAGITDLLKQIGMPNLGNLMAEPAQTGWYSSIQGGYERLKAAGQPWTREAYQQLMADQGVNPDVAGKLFDEAGAFNQRYGRFPNESDVTAMLKQLQPGWTPTNPGLGGGGTTPGGGGNDDASLDAIWSSQSYLKDFYQGNGRDVSTPEKQRAAVRNWIETANPQFKGMTPTQVLQALQKQTAPAAGLAQSVTDPNAIGQPVGSQPYTGQATAQAASALMQGATQTPGTFDPNYYKNNPGQLPPFDPANQHGMGLQGSTGGFPERRGSAPAGIDPNVWNALTPDAAALYRKQGYLVQNPHQQNIANWNAMSSTGQQAALGAVEGGLTPSGAWSKEDWLKQMYAAAPKGTAPRQVSTNWGSLGQGY